MRERNHGISFGHLRKDIYQVLILYYEILDIHRNIILIMDISYDIQPCTKASIVSINWWKVSPFPFTNPINFKITSRRNFYFCFFLNSLSVEVFIFNLFFVKNSNRIHRTSICPQPEKMPLIGLILFLRIASFIGVLMRMLQQRTSLFSFTLFFSDIEFWATYSSRSYRKNNWKL